MPSHWCACLGGRYFRHPRARNAGMDGPWRQAWALDNLRPARHGSDCGHPRRVARGPSAHIACNRRHSTLASAIAAARPRACQCPSLARRCIDLDRRAPCRRCALSSFLASRHGFAVNAARAVRVRGHRRTSRQRLGWVHPFDSFQPPIDRLGRDTGPVMRTIAPPNRSLGG